MKGNKKGLWVIGIILVLILLINGGKKEAFDEYPGWIECEEDARISIAEGDLCVSECVHLSSTMYDCLVSKGQDAYISGWYYYYRKSDMTCSQIYNSPSYPDVKDLMYCVWGGVAPGFGGCTCVGPCPSGTTLQCNPVGGECCIQDECYLQCFSETQRIDSCTGSIVACPSPTSYCRADVCVLCLLDSHCGSGYTCNVAGQCIPTQTCDNDGICESGETQQNCFNDCKCSDSDGGSITNVYGTIKIGTQQKAQDSCSDSTHVREYICGTSDPYYPYSILSCGTGETCSNGKCSGVVNTCVHPDDGTTEQVGFEFCRWDYPQDEYLYECKSDGTWQSTFCLAGCDDTTLTCLSGECYTGQYRNEDCVSTTIKEYEYCNANRLWEDKTENCGNGEICEDGTCINQPTTKTCSDLSGTWGTTVCPTTNSTDITSSVTDNSDKGSNTYCCKPKAQTCELFQTEKDGKCVMAPWIWIVLGFVGLMVFRKVLGKK